MQIRDIRWQMARYWAQVALSLVLREKERRRGGAAETKGGEVATSSADLEFLVVSSLRPVDLGRGYVDNCREGTDHFGFSRGWLDDKWRGSDE